MVPLSEAKAGEGVKPAGPIGGTDIGQALLPPTGLYGALYGAAINIDAWFDDAGSRVPAGGNSFSGGGGLMYVYPWQIFGGSIASTLAGGFERTCIGFKPAPEQCSSGARDIYSDIFFWSRLFPSADFANQPDNGPKIPYGLAIGFGLGVSFPTGQYSADRAVNIGANVFDVAPSVALTYNTRSLLGEMFGQATEFSGRLFLNNYTRNSDTEWQSGRLLNLDFAITQRQNQWQYGLAGIATYQIENDVVHGINIGNRAKGLAVGPIVSYNFDLDGRSYNFAAKGLFTVAGENSTSSQVLVVRLGTKF